MPTYETRTFQHKDKQYEIRISTDGHTFRVRAFVNGKPANGFAYSVEVATHLDGAVTGAHTDLLATLVNVAKEDVCNGTWERYVSAVGASGVRL